MAIQSASKDFIVKNGLVVNTTATILGETQSVSTTTGAVIVKGGVGVGGNVNAANLFVANNGKIGLYSTNSYYVSFTGPQTLTTSTTWTLPNTPGSVGQFLQLSSSQILTWADINTDQGEVFPIGDLMRQAPLGDRDPTETVLGSLGENLDAFGVSLEFIYDCMDPEGYLFTKDLGTLT